MQSREEKGAATPRGSGQPRSAVSAPRSAGFLHTLVGTQRYLLSNSRRTEGKQGHTNTFNVKSKLIAKNDIHRYKYNKATEFNTAFPCAIAPSGHALLSPMAFRRIYLKLLIELSAPAHPISGSVTALTPLSPILRAHGWEATTLKINRTQAHLCCWDVSFLVTKCVSEM